MSLSKAVSTASRDLRVGEIDGWDYKFISSEKILELKANNKLLQFIDFNGQIYGYEYSEFDNMNELIIISGGSGTGKDTIFNSLVNDGDVQIFKETKTKFLFSVPDTISIFDNYAKEKGIHSLNIYLYVHENERFRRIIYGTILSDKKLVQKYNLEERNLHINIDLYLSVEVTSVSKENLKDLIIMQEDTEVREIIETAKKRILRDRKNPFEDGIIKQKEAGIKIITIDISNLSIEEAKKEILSVINVNRNK